MESRYNLRSPAVKRLMREAQELAEPTEQYCAQPLEDNLFEWHFTIRGPSDSDFDGGVYHGRIILPPDYPMKPPSIMFLTPNGRFDCFTKICLSISKHHPESWQPSWSIRTALLAIIGFMPSPGHGAIGSLDYTPTERSQMARRSNSYVCDHCGPTHDKVLPLTAKSEETKEEIKNLAAQLSMTGEKAKRPALEDAGGEFPLHRPTDASSKPGLVSSVPESTTAVRRHLHSGAGAPTSPTAGSVSVPTADIQSADAQSPSNTQTVPSNAQTAPSNPQTVPSNTQTVPNNPQTLPRNPQAMPRNPQMVPNARQSLADSEVQRRGSRSCFDVVTFWALVVIGLLLGLLILRRVVRHQGDYMEP